MEAMNTHEIARGALLSAIYGVLLEINLFSSLSIENLVPFLFAVPLLCAAARSSRKMLQADLACMLVLTILLSGMSTWLLAGSMLLGAYFLGRPFCLSRKAAPQNQPSDSEAEKALQKGFAACLIVQVLSSFASMTLLAGLFGYSMSEDAALFAMFGHILQPFSLIFLISVIVGFCESLVMFLMMQVILILFRRKRESALSLPVPDRRSAIAFGLSLAGAVFFLQAGVLKWTLVCRDLFVIVWCFLAIWMDFYGTVLMLKSHGSSSRMDALLRLLITLCAFVPGLCLIPMVRGLIAAVQNDPKHRLE